MRLIGTVNHEDDARKIVGYLKRKGIESDCDSTFDARTGAINYQIWAHDEDRLDEAKNELANFKKNPSGLEYEFEQEMIFQKEKTKETASPFTVLIIAFCIFIYFFNFAQELEVQKSERQIVITPVQKALFFDLPPQLDDVQAITKIDDLKVWPGLYPWIVAKIKNEPIVTGPFFIKIRQGDVWRLASPAILHTNWLHILFNMLWAWTLSRMVEFRIGFFRIFILSLIIAIGANIAQYLMGGPFFLGYSGVVLGLAGFIWMRERIAPWEGYPISRSTFLFLVIYTLGMLLVQIAAFFIQIFTDIQFTPIIANTAHIVGAIIGMLLGKFSFFSQRLR